MKAVITTAAISGLLAVILGAFGAHALKGVLSPEMLDTYKTGNQYHFYHTFALLTVGILMHFNQSKMLWWSSYLFTTGLILFSGSLYVMAVSDIKALGMITPLGGIAWIIAWVFLIVHSSKFVPSK